LTVPPARFGRQIRLMRLLGFEFRGLDDVAAWLGGRDGRVGRPIALTFDDGYADVYHHALPLLAEQGIPAVMFVVAQRGVDDWVTWGRREHLPLADWGQMREMGAAGMMFGSHTLTHAHLTLCDDARLAAETADSKRLIEDMLGLQVRHFSYPYGEFDERVVDAVREAGYATACTTVKKAVRPGANPLRLPRLTIGKRMGTLRFLLRVLVRH
jgi:peptidoglycan/xylan/chitin deacetylase (PgdA/CDA1 family)